MVACQTGHLSALRHGNTAYKGFSAIPACQTGHLSTHRHGNPAYKGFSAIPACQSITQPTSNRSHPSVLPGLRHGYPAHNSLSAIPACQTGHLSALRHGDHAHKYSRGILAWRSITQPISDRSHPSVLPGLRHSDPTHKPSVQSPRVKPVIYRHFDTGTLPTGLSEADCLAR